MIAYGSVLSDVNVSQYCRTGASNSITFRLRVMSALFAERTPSQRERGGHPVVVVVATMLRRGVTRADEPKGNLDLARGAIGAYGGICRAQSLAGLGGYRLAGCGGTVGEALSLPLLLNGAWGFAQERLRRLL